MNVIRRQYGFREIKLASSESGQMEFSGYGAVFNNVDFYGDLIAPGAFADTLAESQKTGQWPSMLLQHGGWGVSADDMMPIGVWIEMAEDGKGLKVTGRLAETSRGTEAYTLLKMSPRSALNGLSIGYIAKEWEPRSKPDEPRRTLKKIELIEISLVTLPANPKARVESVKSLEDIQRESELEAFLREAGGFSRSEAKALIAKAKALSPREAGDDLVGLTAALVRNTHLLKGA